MWSKPLVIGIDARPLQNYHRYRGIGQFLFNTLEAIAKADHTNRYILYLLMDNEEGLPPLDSKFNYEIKIAPPVRLGWRAVIDYWRPAKAMAWLESSDVFFQPDIAGGLPRTMPTATILYDLIPLVFRRHYFLAWQFIPKPGFVAQNKNAAMSRLLYRQQLRLYKKATAVLPISDATRHDAVKLLGLKSSCLHIIHLAPVVTGRPDSTVLKTLKITKPYILYVGSIDYRKNVPALISAFNAARDRGFDVQLVLVGKDFTLPATQSKEAESIRQQKFSSPYRDDIIITGFVDDVQHHTLYKKAVAFVFPSLYEGFGMPVLEAMAIGCPVIALNNSSIPEVADSAVMLLDSADQLADSIIKLLTNPAESKRMVAKGREQAAKFSWDKTASEILAVIDKAGGKK